MPKITATRDDRDRLTLRIEESGSRPYAVSMGREDAEEMVHQVLLALAAPRSLHVGPAE